MVGRAVPARQELESLLHLCSASGGHGPPLECLYELKSRFDSLLLGLGPGTRLDEFAETSAALAWKSHTISRLITE